MNHLKETLDALQEDLKASLASGRRGFRHSVGKGDTAEDVWLEFLRNHLPRRYQIDRAFVMDAKGRESEQLDLVIYDWQYTPQLYQQNPYYRHRWIPAESVYAVFEVKQTLQRENLLAAGKKVASIRGLERTSAPIVHAGGIVQDPKPPFRILGGILCLESQWSLPFEEPLQRTLADLNLDEQVDLGCCIGGGSFEVGWASGPAVTRTVTPEQALPFFLLRLLARLQSLGTVPAIDYERYSASLDLPESS